MASKYSGPLLSTDSSTSMKNVSKPVTKLIVPLAGLGIRFSPSSTVYPKELAQLANKPVIQYLVEEAWESGIKEVIFVINSSKNSIESYFSQRHQDAYLKRTLTKLKDLPEDLKRLHDLIKKIKFKYVKRQSTLGDGHSILLARKFINKNEPFAVSMGDLLGLGKEPFIKQLIDIYQSKKSPVISVEKMPLDVVSRFGVIALGKSRGRLHEVINIIEKPKPNHVPSRLVLTGKYILTPEFFSLLEDLVKKHKSGEVKLADALKVYAGQHKLYAYECKGHIQDTGNKLDFIKAAINFGLENEKYKQPLKKFIKTL